MIQGKEEIQTRFAEVDGRFKSYIDYHFETKTGKIFTCLSDTLSGARNKRNEWLQRNGE